MNYTYFNVYYCGIFLCISMIFPESKVYITISAVLLYVITKAILELSDEWTKDE